VHFYKFFRASLLRILTALLLVATLLTAPAFSLDSEDSQIFISGFHAYQKKDYKTAIDSMSTLLRMYPDTPLKDMAVFWLARANYKAGNRQEAAKYMAQFFREYPDSPLVGTVEEGLVALADRYQKGEQIEPAGAARVPAANGTAAGEVPAAERNRASEKQAKSQEMREKAIAAYKAVIDRFPGTDAAASASAKLRQLGVEYPPVTQAAPVSAPPQGEVAQTFNLEVAQVADLDVRLGPAPETEEVGKPFAIPLDITNTGNGSDRFHLESGFPPEYGFHFAAASTPDVPINSTPNLAVGEKFRAVLVGVIPRTNKAGQKNNFPVKIISAFAKEVSQSREIVLVSSAPLLRADVKSEKPVRADVVKNELEKKESSVSAASAVQRGSGVAARTPAQKLVVIPGQLVTIPLIVTNTGNVKEVFGIKAKIAGGATYTFYNDLNRDGKVQPNEPIINFVGPLSPKEEAYVVLEIATPVSAGDGVVAPVSVLFEPENSADRPAVVDLQLTYSRPVLELTMAAKGGRLKPGELSSLELNCVNRGSNVAKQVTLQSILPPKLEVVASEPGFTQGADGIYVWKFDELGAGEKRNIKVTYRVKPGVAVGTNMQLKTLLNYQDLIGNRY